MPPGPTEGGGSGPGAEDWTTLLGSAENNRATLRLHKREHHIKRRWMHTGGIWIDSQCRNGRVVDLIEQVRRAQVMHGARNEDLRRALKGKPQPRVRLHRAFLTAGAAAAGSCDHLPGQLPSPHGSLDQPACPPCHRWPRSA